VGGGGGLQSRDPPVDIPRSISSWERDVVCIGPARGQDDGDAPCAQRESARALQSGRSQQEEDWQISMLWSDDLQHPLEYHHPYINIQTVSKRC